MMRTPVIAGNWKMNPTTLSEATELALAVRRVADEIESVTSVVCPPAVWLADVARSIAGGRLELGAQTMHFEEKGAFTGETSPLMLAGVATFVIIGHSERRQYDNETDEKVGRKVASAVAHGLRPIAAVGERAEERRAGATEAVIDRQVRAALAGLERLAGTGLVIAYEPVWAIGTGDAASGADAQAVAAQIRAILRELDAEAADEIPIQYGGSVTADNAAEYFTQADIDGALVGGASLKPETFGAILRAGAAAVGAA
ncbi:MAG TPA: triose-phosphate isomerase [Candidatus Limnocylindria bacterium]|nr:triose-phosphate isomerase [Candidatus Limnocylindria bacterium]